MGFQPISESSTLTYCLNVAGIDSKFGWCGHEFESHLESFLLTSVSLFIYDMEALIAQLKGCLLLDCVDRESNYVLYIALCSDTHLSGDVTHLALQERSYRF